MFFEVPAERVSTFGATVSTRIRCHGCGTEWPASTEKCYRCGMSLGLMAGYDADDIADEDFDEELSSPRKKKKKKSKARGVFRSGKKLVMIEGCKMPERCAICNAEDVTDTVHLTLSRQSKQMTGISGILQAGIDKLSGWNYTGPVEVEVNFCQSHSRRFVIRMAFAVLICILSFIYLGVRYQFSKHDPNAAVPLDVVAGIVGAVGGLTAIGLTAKNPDGCWFRPQRFDDRTVWVSGAGSRFLDSLQEYPVS